MSDGVVKPDDPPCCEFCGKEAAVVIDGTAWCASCLHARGSCCAESEMVEADDR